MGEFLDLTHPSCSERKASMEKDWYAWYCTHISLRPPPEGEEYLEEMAYEGITETYVPILQMLDKLVNEDVDFRITISSASLISMLRDELV